MLAISDTPPPVHVTTAQGTTRMAQSSFCWGSRCVDYVEPGDRDDVPRVVVSRGERMRFHLRFAPSEVAVLLPHRSIPLHAKQRPVWRVKGMPRWLVLFARARGGGDTSYAISVRVAP